MATSGCHHVLCLRLHGVLKGVRGKSIGLPQAPDGPEHCSIVDEFFAHVREHEMTVAVLDVCLGDASGLEVQAKLHDISPGTRVVVMTGRDQPGWQSAAMQNGARAFLLKPFEDEIFPAHVHNAPAIAS